MNEQYDWSVVEKNILITGSSRGIGFHAALDLAKQGAHVIIVSHNIEHCKNAVTSIRDKAGESSARYYVVDLSVQDEIHHLASTVLEDYDRLDVLINNVAGWFPKYEESEDGIEMNLALNHLSYFLLTGLLFDRVMASSPARIINVSSDAHRQVKGIRFDDIQFDTKYQAYPAYAQSKLANIMFTYELARRLEGTDVTANALHPGLVGTDLYRRYGFLSPILKSIFQIVGKSPEQGAETPVYLASSPELSDVNGKYFVDKKEKRSSEASYDREAAQRLWEISEEMTDFTYPV